ncbi:EfeM/EfeO family lipoprotein [Pseudonocardiaceae bacterium YIM PH 21723]|nr:EfeM/EfeO family lipoprotein [Pseudonocardiaceae bacterium YIM PH 21723]
MNAYRIGAALLTAGLLASCSGGGSDKGTTITVQTSDTECKLSANTAPAGTITFSITNNGSKVTEFYLYRQDGSVAAEKENIGAGLKFDYTTKVNDGGTYIATCKPGMVGDGIRSDFTVTGNAGKTTDPKLKQAVADYKTYVGKQADLLLADTTRFVEAVKGGNVEQAKALFPVARTPWEKIEPVAESFGDIDPKIDGREDDAVNGQKFTGFHRLEKDLWVSGLQPDSGAIADQLLADVKDLVGKAKAVDHEPVAMANGAKELLDEVVTGKSTGEEDRYSHTDLWDFAANVDGAEQVITALTPYLQEKDPKLLSTLQEKFTALNTLLAKQKRGDGYRTFTELQVNPGADKPELTTEGKELTKAVDALGEPLSKVAGVVAG